MKKFFFLAIAATALASCSSDNLVDLKEGDEIKFTAVADNDSRAETVFCNNNLPADFQLYAATNATPAVNFIVDETFKRSGSSTTYLRKDGSTRYWPEYDQLDFYAFKNATINWTAGSVPTGSFEVDDVVESQLDFVYAAKQDQGKPVVGGNVALNFRHALSQIEFKVVNNNPDIRVEILNVKVGNAWSKGDFTFPETTDVNWENHNQAEDDMTTGTVIAWSNQTVAKSYQLSEDFTLVSVKDGENAKELTFEVNDGKDGVNYNEIYKQSMLLLPQNTTAWTTTAKTGTYLAVKCRIWNVCGTEEVLLYGDADGDKTIEEGEGRWASVPVAFAWQPGYKYVYTFNFADEGNAGYEDTNGDGVPTDKAVLVPMTVNVTVDDFQPGTVTPDPTPMETN